MSEPRNAINLAGVEALAGDSREIARLWVTHRGPATIFINPGHLADPAMFGMLLVDTARHAARAYAQAQGRDESEMLTRLWQGFDTERDTPTSELSVPAGKGSNP
jgi:hypothetical protein